MGLREAVRARPVLRLRAAAAHLRAAPAASPAELTTVENAAVSDVLRSHDHTVHDVSHGPLRENGRRPFANHLSHGVIALAELGADASALRAWADHNGAHSQGRSVEPVGGCARPRGGAGTARPAQELHRPGGVLCC